MSDPYRFSLFSIVQVIKENRRFIAVVTLCAALVGLLFSFLKVKQYEAKAEFFLRNPFYTDRSYLYNTDTRLIDYFATEDEMNRLLALSQADSIQNRVIKEMHLAAAYKFDSSKPEEVVMLRKYFNNNLTVWRSENRSVEMSFIDRDPERAAAIANRVIMLLEVSLRSFYNDTRRNMHATIMSKVREDDSTINALTDTLVRLREQYGIYDIISPARHNIMLSSMDKGGEGYARGIEVVQNIESVKDQMVTDRARQLSIANQYNTGAKVNEMPLIHLIKAATPPYKQKGPGKTLITITCAFLGFFFSTLYVLFVRFYKVGA